jgi:hypothetical protein
MAKNRANKNGIQNYKPINPINAQPKPETAAYEKKIDPKVDPITQLFQPKLKLTQEQIAERAYLIWENRGCTPGEDEQNWIEAEKQLKTELGLD